MSDANRELLRRAWAAFDRFDFEAFGACLTHDWREYDSDGNVVSTREQEQHAMELQRSAFPDRRTDIHRIVANADLVACHCTITSTHSGTYLDAEPTGKRLVTRVMMFSRVEHGRLAETWAMSEGGNLYEQITGRPAPDAA
jgi:aspartyl-tRNA synthetase